MFWIIELFRNHLLHDITLVGVLFGQGMLGKWVVLCVTVALVGQSSLSRYVRMDVMMLSSLLLSSLHRNLCVVMLK